MKPYIALSPHPRAYVQAWKTVIQAAKDSQNVEFITPDRCFHLTPQEARADFLKALHNRINARAGYTRRGRYDDCDYLAAARRDQHRIREMIMLRVRHYQLETREARARFSHLLAHYDD